MAKLIIFDMDGLMLDTEQIYFRAFRDTSDSFGLTLRTDLYMQTIGADDEAELEIYKSAFPDLDGLAFHNAVQDRCAALMKAGEYSVKPGLFELLRAIESKGGIKTAVVTANRKKVAVDLLTKTGIMPHLNGGVYREMVTRGKPFPDSHLLCCQMFSANPWEALVLEDSEIGICAALSAEIPVIAIPDLAEPSDEVLAQCVARCNTLMDVIPFI